MSALAWPARILIDGAYFGALQSTSSLGPVLGRMVGTALGAAPTRNGRALRASEEAASGTQNVEEKGDW
jgi:hypothetical protein